MRYLTGEWLKAAADDLSTIGKIMGDENLTQVVAFHAQQAVEKSLKALLEEHGIDVPKIHDIVRLQKLVEKHVNLSDEQMRTLIKINELYIDSRYPGESGLLPNGKPGVTDAEEFYAFAVLINNIIKVKTE